MQNEVAVIQESAVGDALHASAIRAQVDLIQHVMKEVMLKDTHYGVIPGTPKPSLYKPGAEKLCLTFRLDPQYTSTERFVGEHLFINSTCTLFHQTTGRRLGSGQGSCSTKESKYAYRKGQRKCPKCGAEAIIKGKSEYGGGWLCYQKRSGCGAKWKDGAVEIESQNTDRIPNEDLADQYNTVLKMANKRSLIAAVLNVTAASDLFTQDIEDMPHQEEKEHPPLPKGAEMLAKMEERAADPEPGYVDLNAAGLLTITESPAMPYIRNISAANDAKEATHAYNETPEELRQDCWTAYQAVLKGFAKSKGR